MSPSGKLQVGNRVVVHDVRGRTFSGEVAAVFDNRFELIDEEVANPYEHFSNISAPPEHHRITFFFDDVKDFEVK